MHECYMVIDNMVKLIKLNFNYQKEAVVFCAMAAFLFLAVPGMANDGQEGSSEPLQSVTLQLKWKHQFQFAGYYAAQEKGFYREVGLDVEILEIEGGDESIDKVIEGKADFGIGMSDLILHRAKGEPVVALAAIFQHSPLIILAPKSSGIENIHTLKGKRLGLEAHSAELIAYIEDEGISLKEINILAHGYSVAKLISGKVDAISAYSTDEPFVLLNHGIHYSTFTPRASGIDFYGDTLFTSEAQIKAHPERVSAFLDASLKGWQYALNHSDEIIEIIYSKYTQRHSFEHLAFEAKMSKQLILPDVVEIGYMNPGRWRHIADIYSKLDMIPKDYSFEGFIYNRVPTPLDLRWLYFSLAGVTVLALLAFFVLGRFYRLNRSLNQEMVHRKEIETAREKLVADLQKALNNIKVLSGLLPICSYCKKIRDDKGYWNQIEAYISEHTDTEFSHSICQDCAKKYLPELNLYDDNSNSE